MMQLSKTKPHFWSRLLFSVIAFFALPAAQELETTNAEISGGNYQTQSQKSFSEVLIAARAVLQTPKAHLPQAPEADFVPSFYQAFVSAYLPTHAPIRAGPILS